MAGVIGRWLRASGTFGKYHLIVWGPDRHFHYQTMCNREMRADPWSSALLRLRPGWRTFEGASICRLCERRQIAGYKDWPTSGQGVAR